MGDNLLNVLHYCFCLLWTLFWLVCNGRE